VSLIQQYDGREHTPSGTTFHTDVHGKVGLLHAISGIKASVESKGVSVLGSAYETHWGAPEGKLPKLTLKLLCSGIGPFEQQLRSYFGLSDPKQRIELAQLPLSCKLVSEPVDENEEALPTVVRAFNAFYLGYDPEGSDRSNNDIIMVSIFLQQTTPAETL